ncbi:hypothetical protein P8452_07744 [Trifolium repens]|nr:hypothetical protein P8452_07744 [Trifolium repens]
MLSDGDPILLGNSLVGVSPRVNVGEYDKEDENLNMCRTLVVLPGVTGGKELDVSALGEHGCTEGNMEVSPRAVEGSRGKKVGSSSCFQASSNGPQILQPNFLRTKNGDLSLRSSVKGAVSTFPDVADLGLRDNWLSGPAECPSVGPVTSGAGCLLVHANSSSLPEGTKGGRFKKVVKKSNFFHPYHPGSKQDRFHKLIKGGTKPRRKIGPRGLRKEQNSSSNESDPIDSSDADGEGGQRNQVRVVEGIGLEVVLPFPGGIVDSVCGSVVPVSGRGGVGSGNSGLVDFLDDPMVSNGVTTSGWMVDKARGDAQHVIDIQEDLGVNFKGQGEEDVERCMRLEQRDRQLKLDWVHDNSYE